MSRQQHADRAFTILSANHSNQVNALLRVFPSRRSCILQHHDEESKIRTITTELHYSFSVASFLQAAGTHTASRLDGVQGRGAFNLQRESRRRCPLLCHACCEASLGCPSRPLHYHFPHAATECLHCTLLPMGAGESTHDPTPATFEVRLSPRLHQPPPHGGPHPDLRQCFHGLAIALQSQQTFSRDCTARTVQNSPVFQEATTVLFSPVVALHEDDWEQSRFGEAG